ncbi:MAG TPA: hypothetical protein DIT64_13530 [Verrucomicrobiales bacterium]|nr:hypothetical protein [Verrucomicrobiales bacterium]
MSWIQWRDETLPATQDEARMELRLHAPDMGGPRQCWSLRLAHEVPWPDDGVKRKYRHQCWFTVELLEMGAQVRDVRDFSGMVIRSTPEWLEQVQESDKYGHLVEPVLQLHHGRVSEEKGEFDVWENCLSLEWELRFGQLDGMSLPCELEAWAAIPEKEFYRKQPETPEDLARFAQGEPVLRMMARADIKHARVEMERCGDDPAPLARKRLNEAVRGLMIRREQVGWENNYVSMPEHKAVNEPGWRSVVTFAMRT